MTRILTLALAAGLAAGAASLSPTAFAQTPAPKDSNASPIYGVTVPEGYRDWKVISVAQLRGKVNQLRVQLGNDIAIKAMRDGTRPFPDGAMIAAIHWTNDENEENDKVFESVNFPFQSSTAGKPVNVQFMVKDSKKYPDSAGWGFADFKDGKPQSEELHQACFACHAPAADKDYVFTEYAHTP